MRTLKITKSLVSQENASFNKYLQEIGSEEPLSTDEEVELLHHIQQGDQVALEKLVRANLRFVVPVAIGYQNKGLSLKDLIYNGNFGLIKAAQKFDGTYDTKFRFYAVEFIRKSILQAIRGQHTDITAADLQLMNKVGAILKIKTENNL
jgi:RNA polymerase primary sigma factor